MKIKKMKLNDVVRIKGVAYKVIEVAPKRLVLTPATVPAKKKGAK